MRKSENGCYNFTHPAGPTVSFAIVSCSLKRTGWAANEYSTSFSPSMVNINTLCYSKFSNKKLKLYSTFVTFLFSHHYASLRQTDTSGHWMSENLQRMFKHFTASWCNLHTGTNWTLKHAASNLSSYINKNIFLNKINGWMLNYWAHHRMTHSLSHARAHTHTHT